VITDDQVVVLFAKANPVPSSDLLDPIEPVTPGQLTNRSERGSEMSELMAKEPRVGAPRRGRRLVPAVAAVAVAMVAIPLLVIRGGIVGDGTVSEQVATAFMEAIAEYDGQAAYELFSPDGVHQEGPPVVIVGWSKFDKAVHLARTNQGCDELTSVSFPDGTRADAVECAFIVQTAAGEAMGLDSTTGKFMVYVEDGEIIRTHETFDGEAGVLVMNAFRDWIQDNHPEEYETMFGIPNIPPDNPNTPPDNEAISLFERYTAEFVAEMGS
jgi:hypothetical protein